MKSSSFRRHSPGGLGAGIDFTLIGDSKAQDQGVDLLARWVGLGDMELSNFSQIQAMYFVELSNRLFGASLLGGRQAACLSCYCCWTVTSLIPDERGWDRLQ